jgi:hypothetical protein
MNNKKYHSFETVPKSNQKIAKRAKPISLSHIYMTAHIPALV